MSDKRMNTLSKYALSALLGISISYNANALQFVLHNEFSGGQQPVGSLQVDITNSGANAVDLKITSLLSGTEFLDELYLNLDPALNPTLLSFGAPTRGVGSSFGSDPVVSTGVNAFDADGGGSYDINFQFDIAPPGDRFNNSDSITYHVTGITGLDESDFNFLAAPHGGNGVFTAAAHIQGVGPNADGSGFIAPNGVPGVPDGGSTVMLLGGTLACLGALRRRLA
jgi:protein with PEP-CTERM/exosortase system signal